MSTVDAIKLNYQRDSTGCCRELFKDWLSTDNGVTPKTWSKLLSQLRKVKELTAALDTIEKELEQLQ